MMPSDPRDVWLHDLRNSINNAVMSTVVARRLIEGGEVERGLGFLAEAELACDQCRILMSDERAG